MLGAAASSFCAFACGPAASGPRVAPGTRAGSASQAPSPTVASDGTAAGVPADLVASGRIRNPSALLDVASRWSHFPAPDGPAIAEYLTERSVGNLLDLDQPMDFAVGTAGSGMETRPVVVVSFAVRSADAARAAFQQMKLVPRPDGAVRIEGLGDRSAPSDDAPHCELGPAEGAAPTRLVCGRSDAALDSFSSYLRHAAARAVVASDFHAEIRLAALKSRFAAQRDLGTRALSMLVASRMGSRSLADAASLIGGNLTDFGFDVDTIALDAQLARTSGDLTLTARFVSSTSLFTRLATAHPERTDAPPAAFWQLPEDAQFACFYRGVDASDFAPVRDVVLKMIGEQLASDGVADADKSAVLAALAAMTSSAPTVYASGIDVADVSAKVAHEKATRFGKDASAALAAKHDVAEAIPGYRVFGIDEPQAKFASAARDLVAAWARPGIASAYKAKWPSLAAPTIKLAPLPTGALLPADSVHVIFEAYPVGSDPRTLRLGAIPPPAVGFHALFIPDGARTWVVFAASETMLVAKARAILPSGAASDRLSARADLAMLQNARAGAGGFFSILSLSTTAQQVQVLLGGTMTGLAEFFGRLSANAGQTGIPFTLTAQGAPVSAVATVHLNPSAIDDLRGLAMTILQ